MAVNEHDCIAVKLGDVDRLLDARTRPTDVVRLPHYACAIGHIQDFGDDQPLTILTGISADQDGSRFKPVAGENHALKHFVLALGKGETSSHSPTSFNRAASITARCVITLSVAGFHRVWPFKWRDHCWKV